MKTNTFLPFVLSRCSRFIGVPLFAGLTLALMIPAVAFSQYANPAAVPLGTTAGTYGALGYSGITGTATVYGDVGTATGSVGGGITVASGTNWGTGGQNLTAQTDLATALTNANGRTNDATIAADALGGLNLGRGVYAGGALDLASNTTLTLTGTASDVFIIKAASSLTINSNSTVSLSGGAVWSNVFWYVGSSATIFSGTTFNGIILAEVAITLNSGATSVTTQLLAHTGLVTINSTVLPVELTSFTAALNNNAVELNWNTATEVNNYGFEVEKKPIPNPSQREGNSTDSPFGGKEGGFVKVGFVQGNGNSNSPKEYSFTDKTVSYGSYAYRLKQLDNDGKHTYSDVVEVNVGQIPNGFLLNQNYPNPFNPSTQIQFGVSKNTYATLTVFNVLGVKVSTLFNGNAIAGQVYNVTLSGDNLASGIYYYKLQTNEKNEVRKMILLR